MVKTVVERGGAVKILDTLLAYLQRCFHSTRLGICAACGFSLNALVACSSSIQAEEMEGAGRTLSALSMVIDRGGMRVRSVSGNHISLSEI